MRYVAAFLLASLGGNNSPNVADIKKILSSVGIDVDEASANKVIKELSGKNIEELIAAGKEKLASVPSAGAVAVSAAGGAAAPAAGGGDSAPAEAKKEEKKEESEESDDDMGFGLFD